MQLVIISGRSGSGKSSALNILEDAGYYCVDNLPANLLSLLVEEALSQKIRGYQGFAVSIDARNADSDFNKVISTLKNMPSKVKYDIIYIDASDECLIRRFSETRRKHPLSNSQMMLQQAIALEKQLLEPVARAADLTINTSGMSIQNLRQLIKTRLVKSKDDAGIALLFLSFAYKHGVPIDADYVFDMRCLPNPYWHTELRAYSGLDAQVQEFFAEQSSVKQMQNSIGSFLDIWLPQYSKLDRSYLTIALGCTGGQHRSVYMAQALFESYQNVYSQVQIQHRELAHNS